MTLSTGTSYPSLSRWLNEWGCRRGRHVLRNGKCEVCGRVV